MTKAKLTDEELANELVGETARFPKYVTQLLNLANQNAQGTRPKVVGQMTDLIQQFGKGDYAQWRDWYGAKMPDAIEQATEKVLSMVENLKRAIAEIDREMVLRWVEDLVLAKTFVGLSFQDAILRRIAKLEHTDYRPADAREEAKGIDGFIGGRPVTVKPATYSSKGMLREQLDAVFVVYEKKNGIVFEYELGPSLSFRFILN